MGEIMIRGVKTNIKGNLPAVGNKVKDCLLTTIDMEDISILTWRDKILVLNIFPSVDTPTCSKSVRRFNVEANNLSNVVVACVSMDLPFAQKRFCGAEGLDNIIMLSGFRHPEFGDSEHFGVTIAEGSRQQLFSRAVLIIAEGTVMYSQQVDELTNEPDYETAIQVCKEISEKTAQ